MEIRERDEILRAIQYAIEIIKLKNPELDFYIKYNADDMVLLISTLFKRVFVNYDELRIRKEAITAELNENQKWSTFETATITPHGLSDYIVDGINDVQRYEKDKIESFVFKNMAALAEDIDCAIEEVYEDYLDTYIFYRDDVLRELEEEAEEVKEKISTIEEIKK